MDTINTENLFEAFFRKFSVGTNSRTRFISAFLSSYNDALMDLFTDGHIDEPSLLTSLDDDSALEIKFLPHIKIGISHYLQNEGEWVKGESRDQYSYLNWEKAKTVWQEVTTAESESTETYLYPWGE